MKMPLTKAADNVKKPSSTIVNKRASSFSSGGKFSINGENLC